MILFDVNVLVYAHRADAPNHRSFRDWVEAAIDAEAPFGLSDLVLSGFVRVVTHPRVFSTPTPVETALEFCEALRVRPTCVSVSPGPGHWDIFTRLCSEAGARGNLVPDAYLAAMAIETGSEWITTDRDYSRFPGLRWSHPLEGS